MLSILGNLALKSTPLPPRPRVTPGHLYRLMSAEFRQQRPPRCACRMPMIAFREPARPGGPNWQLEWRRGCDACTPLVGQLASRYAQLYDISNP